MDLSPEKYRNQIREAWSELSVLESLQRKTQQRINDLRDLIRATANFLPNQERLNELILLDVFKVPTSITEAVRLELVIAGATSKTPLSPTDIKSRAEQRGFNFNEYTNPLASIHTILRRMKEGGDIKGDDSFLLTEKGAYLIARELLSADFTQKMMSEAFKRLVKRAETVPLDGTKIDALLRQLGEELAAEEVDKRTRKSDE